MFRLDRSAIHALVNCSIISWKQEENTTMKTFDKLLVDDKELRDVIELSNDGIEVISLLNHFNIDPMILTKKYCNPRVMTRGT